MAKALIVDDVDYIRKSISRVLESNGFECDICSNGKEAIEKAGNNEYDLIITDIMMPEADGYEFLDFIRSQNEPKNQTPVLAISGGDKTINSDIALGTINEKADAVLPKPFAKADLLNAIAKVMGNDKYDEIIKSAVS